MSVALLVMTDGRKHCIERTIPSALENLNGHFTEWIIFDDSGDSDYREWLQKTFPRFKVVHAGKRQGFGGAIRAAWARIQATNCTHVFHLEDDFTFNRQVNVWAMQRVLDTHPYLAQLALRRQPWNDAERAAGGIVELWPDAYTEVDDAIDTWLEQRLFFTTNPSLYRRELTFEAWPLGRGSELGFTHRLLEEGYDGMPGEQIHFAYWGARDSGEAVFHIGDERVGHSY